MAISRKPKPAPAPSESDVEAVIARGGSSSGPVAKPARQGNVKFLVTVRPDVLDAIERARRDHPATSTRNAWILETLVARLRREGYL